MYDKKSTHASGYQTGQDNEMTKAELQNEINEQARLNGMGSEREARLIATIEALAGFADALAESLAFYVPDEYNCEALSDYRNFKQEAGK